MEDAIVTPNQIVNGGCAFADDCRCKMFRSPLLSEPYTCFCTHDISQHEMIGVVDGCVTRYFGPAAVVPTPATPIIPKDTVEAQRREIFLPYAHSGPSSLNRSGGSKRPLSRAPDRPPRSSVGRVTVDSNLVNVICLKRDDKIPTNDLERLEMGVDYIPGISLTTHAKLVKTLKLTSTLGESFMSKYYIFVQDTKRSIRATKHWSKNFPDAATIVCLSRLPCIYILPDCYEDELINFTDPLETDFVEVMGTAQPDEDA